MANVRIWEPRSESEVERASSIRRGATPEARKWLDRAMYELVLNGKKSMVAESCPVCWHPIWREPRADQIVCLCGTEPLWGNFVGERTYPHGLESIIAQFTVEASGVRAD